MMTTAEAAIWISVAAIVLSAIAMCLAWANRP